MEINPALLSLIEEHELDKGQALCFCVLWEQGCHSTIFNMIATGFMTKEDSDVYRITLCKDEGVLKVPMFKQYKSLFSELLSKLTEKGFTRKGHPSNQMAYDVITSDAEEEFNKFVQRTGEAFDIDTFTKMVVSYYATTPTYVKTLKNLIPTFTELDWSNYIETKSNLI